MKSYWVAFTAIITAALISLAYAQATDVQSALPAGWIRAGSAPQLYDMSIQPNAAGVGSAAVLKSRPEADESKFGTLMQQFQAADYRGKSLRFSATVRAKNVTGSGALWMRVDDDSKRTAAFDNMKDRRIVGNKDWTPVEVVLPVTATAQTISFGIMLIGKGELAMRDVEVVAVPSSTPSTAAIAQVPPLVSKPTNLDFKQ